MARQHVNPYIITETGTYQLTATSKEFDEDWLQDFIYRNPHALPVRDIEPLFKDLIPVCRELPTAAGPLDAVFINESGLLTLVECKLWRNAQARREVVAQILDYAKEISRWSYDELESAISRSDHHPGKPLYELVAARSDDLDEAAFHDSVCQNLKRGRFLLLIVGDGITESVELIADFLQQHAHLNFSLALIEIGIFRLPENLLDGYIIHPRVVARTVEIERAVVRIEDGKIVAAMPVTASSTAAPRRMTISEQAFYEKLDEVSPGTADMLKAFFDKARQQLDLSIEPGQNSMKIKSTRYNANFAVFRTINEVYNCAIADTTNAAGYPQVGERYLERLAGLFPGGCVFKPGNRFNWTVKLRDGNRYLKIAECLAVQDKWLDIIKDTLDELAQRAEQTPGDIG
jgi:hypothetical protein